MKKKKNHGCKMDENVVKEGEGEEEEGGEEEEEGGGKKKKK